MYAFWDPDGGDAVDAVRVLYSTEEPAEGTSSPTSAEPFAERRVAFMKFTSAPSLDWLGLEASEFDLDEEDYETLDRIVDAPPPDEIAHRIGGYPSEIQPVQMALACEYAARGLPGPRWRTEIPSSIERASKSWRLLLQIDSDPALKMNFGDAGRLYVFIRAHHARKGDFSKTVTIWQTH